MSEPELTYSYQAYRRYRDGFLNSSNMLNVMGQSRRFYAGDQYEEGLDPNIPKPVMNICFRYVETVCAKITGTPWAVEFNTDDDRKNLRMLDRFYEYQTAQMDDREFTTDVCKTALIDGVAVVVTSYDEDTYGYKGKYRGFLKRKEIPFEDFFAANPYCEDIQDQEYVGYVQRMPIETVWDILERWGDKSKKKLIVEDDHDWQSTEDYSADDIASKEVTVVTRYYRDRTGEVVFDLATKWCDLFRAHHYLNPRKNERLLRTAYADESGRRHDDFEGIAPQKVAMQTPPEKESDSSYEEKLGKFWRYPIAMYRPYPVKGKILGTSVVTQLIPIQKVINFCMMMNAMSAQNHGMPKWAVKEGALVDGEEISNDPSQVLRVNLRPGDGSIDSVLKRIEASATSGDLLNLGSATEKLAEQVYGFDNLMDDGNMNDTSGYAIQQVQKQKNLVLEIPQMRLWRYVKDTARTDLLFYRHYVEEAKFYTERDEGEMSLQNSTRAMAQSVGDATGIKPGADEGGQLPTVPRTLVHTIGTAEFMKNWEVSVDVTEGIAGSQIAESQHIQNVFASFNTGNVDASIMRAEIESDPAISRKTRSVILNSLDAVENSQLAQKQAEIDQLKNVVMQLTQQIKQYGQQVDYANQRVKSLEQAAADNAQVNKSITDSYAKENRNLRSQLGLEDEGQVKSDNARGIEGGSFGQYI